MFYSLRWQLPPCPLFCQPISQQGGLATKGNFTCKTFSLLWLHPLVQTTSSSFSAHCVMQIFIHGFPLSKLVLLAKVLGLVTWNETPVSMRALNENVMAVKTLHASSISHLFRNLKLWGFKAVQIWSSACLVTGWTFFSIFGMPTSLKTNSAHSCKFFGLCANNLNTIILFGKPHKLQSVSHQK